MLSQLLSKSFQPVILKTFPASCSLDIFSQPYLKMFLSIILTVIWNWCQVCLWTNKKAMHFCTNSVTKLKQSAKQLDLFEVVKSSHLYIDINLPVVWNSCQLSIMIIITYKLFIKNRIKKLLTPKTLNNWLNVYFPFFFFT